jgi:probable rRNA maturation factor
MGRKRAAGRLRVAVSDARGRAVNDRGLARWLVRTAPTGAGGELSVALVSDARMRQLNRRYRRCGHATDVLSFPAASDPVSGAGELRHARRFLGDVVIARGVARRQARAAGHAETSEIRLLALHGLLHLLGYDHERDDGEMERLERQLRKKGGL